VLRKATPERLSAFSDGVFAVLITVLVLELRPPELPTFTALGALWHTWLSYAVSYVFIAIVWVNHHYLMRYADEATPRLLWVNFAFYALVFFLVNATYVGLIWGLLDPMRVEVEPAVRMAMLLRSAATLGLFGLAGLIALALPLVGLGICIACLAVYLRPEPPELPSRLQPPENDAVP
jgi:hypothetical protein